MPLPRAPREIKVLPWLKVQVPDARPRTLTPPGPPGRRRTVQRIGIPNGAFWVLLVLLLALGFTAWR